MAKATLALEIDLRAFSAGLKTALKLGQEFGRQIDGALTGKVKLDTAAFDAELKRYEASLADLKNEDVSIDTSGAVSGLEKISQGVVKAEQQTTTSVGRIRDRLAVWGFAIRGVSSLLNIAGQGAEFIIGASREVERLQLRLHGLYQDAGLAADAYKKFEDVAKRTPATLQQVTEAGATLKAFGLDAVATLDSVVDLSSYMGMDLVEAASAVGRSFQGGVGASEIFRERGVLALIKSFSGLEDLTTLTLPEFRKVMLETLADPAAGIAGSAERISKSYAGAASNIEDAMFRLRQQLGDGLLPALTKVLNVVIAVIDWFAQMNSGLRAAIVILPIATAAWYKLAASKLAAATASGTLTAAILSAVASLKAFLVTIGPVGWALMALTAGVTAYAIASGKQSAAMSETEGKAAELSSEFDYLTGKILEYKEATDLTAAEQEKMAGYIDRLNEKHPELFKNVDLMRVGYDEAAKAINSAKREIDGLIDSMIRQTVVEENSERIAKLVRGRAEAQKAIGELQEQVSNMQSNPALKGSVYEAMLESQISALEAGIMRTREKERELREEIDRMVSGLGGSGGDAEGGGGGGNDFTNERLALLDAFYQEMKWKAAGYEEYMIGVYAGERDEFIRVVGDKDKAISQYDERIRLLGEERAEWEAKLAAMSPAELALLKEKEDLTAQYYETVKWAADDYHARMLAQYEADKLKYIEVVGDKEKADELYQIKVEKLERERTAWEAEQMSARINAGRLENSERIKLLDAQIEKLEKWKSLGLSVDDELKAAWVSYHETLKAQSAASKKAWEDASSGKVDATEAEIAILKALYEADYEAYLVALDKRKQAELMVQEALMRKWEQDNKFKVGMINSIADSMRSMWMTVLDTNMTGSERVKVLWQSMVSNWVSLIGNMSSEWLKNEIKRLAMKSSTDKAETAITAQGEATRTGIIAGSLVKQIALKTAAAVKSVAIYLYETAAALTAWYAKILGPFAPIATLGTMAAVVGMINTFRKGFAGGGYTGDGARNDEAGVVHRGEYVFEQPITKKNIRGLAWLRQKLQQGFSIEEIIPSVNMRYAAVPVVAGGGGYAGGGYVGGSAGGYGRGDNNDSMSAVLAELKALRKLWEDGVKAKMSFSRRELSLEAEKGSYERQGIR